MNLLFLGIGIVYLYLTYQLPTRRIAGDPGISIMPYAYGILAVALAAYHVVRDGLKSAKSVQWRQVAHVGVISLVMLVYVGLMRPLGFEVSTALFLIAVAALFRRPSGVRDWVVIGVFAVVTTVVISLLFGGVFNVNLPKAEWLSGGRGW